MLGEGEAKLGITEIQVGVPFPTSALEAVRQGLADSGAELCGLIMKPVGQIVEGSLRVRHLSDQAARLLARDLAAWPGVTSASVEHQWVRP